MIDHVDLRHLRYFVAAAEELHFTRAAERIGIAQPALSQQMQKLERELGTPLFHRERRRITLTDAGAVLLEEARRLLADFGRTVSRVEEIGRGETGTLVVAFAASVMFVALPKLIRRFRTQFPDVRLELLELNSAQQVEGIASGAIDLGFVREAQLHESLQERTILREPLVVAVAKSHRLAGRKRVALRELAGDDFVLFPRDVSPGLHARVTSLCLDAGFSPRIVQVSRELYTTVSLVESGLGVTIIPSSIRKMGWTGVRYLAIAAADASTRIDMTWRTGNTRPVLRAFMDVARAAALP